MTVHMDLCDNCGERKKEDYKFVNIALDSPLFGNFSFCIPCATEFRNRIKSNIDKYSEEVANIKVSQTKAKTTRKDRSVDDRALQI